MAVTAMIMLVLILSTSTSVRTATKLSASQRDIDVSVTGTGGIAMTSYVAEDESGSVEDIDAVCSELPRMPSNHVFQPRAEEVRKLQEKFDSLEMTNPGDVVMTVYITGDPASGKTQLAGQFGREFFEKNKHKKKKLFVGTLSVDSRSNFLHKYLQVARHLRCVTENTEVAILLYQLDELTSLRMLSERVKKELRGRPGWLLIIDGLRPNERSVNELSPFWPQPNERNWGKGYVLVTTQGPAPTGPSIDMLDLRSGMSEKDAVELLTRESGCSDKEGAVELVNSLDRSPLSVAW